MSINDLHQIMLYGSDYPQALTTAQLALDSDQAVIMPATHYNGAARELMLAVCVRVDGQDRVFFDVEAIDPLAHESAILEDLLTDVAAEMHKSLLNPRALADDVAIFSIAADNVQSLRLHAVLRQPFGAPLQVVDLNALEYDKSIDWTRFNDMRISKHTSLSDYIADPDLTRFKDTRLLICDIDRLHGFETELLVFTSPHGMTRVSLQNGIQTSASSISVNQPL